ncbi:MAG: helicase-related protein, partial [Rhodobiaceae bacterium]
DRLAVRTFVGPWDGVVLREAIKREMFRGGQVFCVCPRIEDLQRVYDRLTALVPDARILSAHGRMPAAELDNVMTKFADGDADILLSTNIVESGTCSACHSSTSFAGVSGVGVSAPMPI